MKKIIILALFALTSPAYADGPSAPLNDPEVIAPARGEWTGPYAGVAVGTATHQTPTEHQFTCDDAGGLDWRGGCDPRIPDTLVGNPDINTIPDKSGNCENYSIACVTQRDADGNATHVWMPASGFTYRLGEHAVSERAALAFVGYRHQNLRNNFTYGVEAGFGNASYIEAQAGFAVNRVLPYVSAGMLHVKESGAFLGVGVDVRVGKQWLFGTKFQKSQNESLATLRIGLKF